MFILLGEYINFRKTLCAMRYVQTPCGALTGGTKKVTRKAAAQATNNSFEIGGS